MSIRLIATDLDGTLMPDWAAVPGEETFRLIRELAKKDVLFAATSGRQYFNMRRLFAPVRDDVLFICDNGCNVIYRNHVMSRSVMDRALAFGIIDDIQAMGPECGVIVCTPDANWLIPKTEDFTLEMLHKWGMTVCVADRKEQITDEIMKVSLRMAGGVTEETEAYLKSRWQGRVRHIAPSGRDWLDLQNACKGTAMTEVMNKFGLAPDEVAAFGDNFNDIEMLDVAGDSYAMETSHPEVKKHARHICRRVEDDICLILKRLE